MGIVESVHLEVLSQGAYVCLCAPVPEIRAADWRGAGVPGVRCRVGPSSGRTVGSRVYAAAGRTLSLAPQPTSDCCLRPDQCAVGRDLTDSLPCGRHLDREWVGKESESVQAGGG